MTNVKLPTMLEAEGPDNLSRALDAVYEKNHTTEDNYILYRMGSQLSLLRVDLSQKPCHIWYCDSDHRPATSSVLKVIEAFLENKFGQPGISGKVFHDLYKLHDRSPTLKATQMGGVSGSLGLPEQRLQNAYARLEAIRHSPELAASAGMFGLFAPKTTAAEPTPPERKLKK